MIWDVLAILLAAWFSAILHSLAVQSSGGVESRLFIDGGDGITLFGIIVGPLILRDPALVTCSCLADSREVLRSVSMRMALLAGLLLAYGYLSRSLPLLPRTWFVTWCGLAFAGLMAGRLAMAQSVAALQGRGELRERVAIVGDCRLGELLATQLRTASGQSLDIVGVFGDERNGSDATLSHLVTLGRQSPIDLAIIALPPDRLDRAIEITRALKALDVQVGPLPARDQCRPCTQPSPSTRRLRVHFAGKSTDPEPGTSSSK